MITQHDCSRLPLVTHTFLLDKERCNVYMNTLMAICMQAKEMEIAEKIELDGSHEMNLSLGELAGQFTEEHFSPAVTDKAAHFCKLYDWAYDKLLEAFAPKLTYRVDISYTECGHIYVEASSEEQAVILAKREIEAKGRDAIEPDEDVNVEPDDIQCINEVCCID